MADAQGLSYYSDASLIRHLNMDGLVLSASYRHLVQAGLIAYEKPFYQVLSLEPVTAPRSGPMSVGEILRRAMGVSHDRLPNLLSDSAPVQALPGAAGVGHRH